jgi:hypothetical protein
MVDCAFAVTSAADILALADGPRAESKRRLLAQYLRNPFLDDDLHALSVRLGAARAEVGLLVSELRAEGLLKESGRRGYTLDLATLALDAGPAGSTAAVVGLPPEALIAQQSGPVTPAVTRTPAAAPGSLPVGLLLFAADGGVEVANGEAAAWLGIPAAELDAGTFAALTGIDPAVVLDGAPQLTRLLDHPRPLQVTLQACCIGPQAGVLVVLQETRAGALLSPAPVPEDLLARLRGRVSAPVLTIRQFLERPTVDGLEQARLALEQVTRFLDAYLVPPKPGSSTRQRA